MEITLLGTSSMVPTQERNHSAALLSYKGENILIDCGEGTQRQFRKAKISAMKITKILISHWHGDHILGLPGLFLTLGSQGYAGSLEIYGPKGTKKFVQDLFSFFIQQNKISYTVTEVGEGVFFENEDFQLEAIELEHSTRCLGFSFVEKNKRRVDMQALKKIGVRAGPELKKLKDGKDIVLQGKKISAKKYTQLSLGKKVSFVNDTRMCNNAVVLAKKADLLFCESTYLHDMVDTAEKRGHMTAKQAAQVAKRAKVGRLVLIHFSQRYADLSLFEKEAKKVFSHVSIGRDFLRFTV